MYTNSYQSVPGKVFKLNKVSAISQNLEEEYAPFVHFKDELEYSQIPHVCTWACARDVKRYTHIYIDNNTIIVQADGKVLKKSRPQTSGTILRSQTREFFLKYEIMKKHEHKQRKYLNEDKIQMYSQLITNL